MNLSPELQAVLLELADVERAQSRPKRRSPQEQELDDLIAQRERLASAASAAQMAVDDLELEILRIQEDERKLKSANWTTNASSPPRPTRSAARTSNTTATPPSRAWPTSTPS